jgi:hypothetical protein
MQAAATAPPSSPIISLRNFSAHQGSASCNVRKVLSCKQFRSFLTEVIAMHCVAAALGDAH